MQIALLLVTVSQFAVEHDHPGTTTGYSEDPPSCTGYDCDEALAFETAMESAMPPLDVEAPSDLKIEKVMPAAIRVLSDGSRVLFDADRLRTREGEVIEGCVDTNDNCSWWAEIGECYKNPSFLIQNCPKACNFCRAAVPKESRCTRDENALPLVQSPGGLNRMFEGIVANKDVQQRYNTTIMSRDPWILTFQNFADPNSWEELESMVAGSFEASSVVADTTDDGKIGRQHLATRTSYNAWCMQAPCLHSELHADLQNRLTEVLGVGSPAFMESLQVLKYAEGQFYHSHHDTILDHITMMPGPRMLTAIIYFNEPEGGGETAFSRLGITVKPEPGMMVLWPSMKDEDSLQVDERTHHEACNVTKGFKHAANLWVHLYDYATPHVLGCAG
eukprot:m.16848 g.16848  ORF g.16848 m.16848 type:complete len:389 (+) comp9121_c0_seq1:374-1540(+)